MHYHGHRERLRERLRDASEKMADYEVLELLLGYVLRRRDTKPLAKELLERFHSLNEVITARPETYLDIAGIGESVADFFALLQELQARRAESRVRRREVLSTPEEVAAMAKARLAHIPHEEIWVAFVDTKNRLLSWERASRGTLNTSMIYPRDLAERALVLKATGLILVHNHPGGDAQPSGSDLNLTQSLHRAVQPLAIRFIDHVIVSEQGCFSMIRDGFL